MPRRCPGSAGHPRPRGTAGAAAGAGRSARSPRPGSSSCDLPVPSAARPPSDRSTAGSPAGESTRPPVPAGPPAARTGPHRLPWQQRLPRLGCVLQTHHDRGSRTSTLSLLTCTNTATVTNYSCRIIGLTVQHHHAPALELEGRAVEQGLRPFLVPRYAQNLVRVSYALAVGVTKARIDQIN